jgi:hypothetical protein
MWTAPPYGGGSGERTEGVVSRRALAITVVVALVLVAAAAITDLVLRTATENRLAGTMGDALGTGGDSHVSIAGGRPFLLQVASGRLDEVRVTADRIALDQGDVTDVSVRAAGVTVREPYTARDVAITATVPTEMVHQRMVENGLEVDLQVAGSAMRASGTVLLVPWGLTLEPRVEGGELLVDVAAADLAGMAVGVDALPGIVRDAVGGLSVPVTGLPDGIELTGADVVAGGLEVTLTGEDVPLPAG